MKRARGSLYRRTRDGQPESVWTISYRANGRRYTERAYSDKAASEALLSQRIRDAARDAVGIGDPYRRHRGRPLAQHLEDYLAGIAGRARSRKHSGLVRSRLLRAFEGMGAVGLADLDLAAAERWLAELLEDGVAVKTRDHYAWALRGFGAWLLDTERVPRNPFHRLHAVATPADSTRERLALTAEQVRQLAEAAEVRPVAAYRKNHPQTLPETLERLRRQGRHRGLLYLFSALTGLRRAECAGIRWCDLELSGAAGAWVTPRAATTKAKRREPLPLDPILAGLLEAWRRDLAVTGGRLPASSAPVFAVPKNLTEQLRKDAEYAGIPLEDEDGRTLDFHALRATCATLMARAGVPLQLARRLIRHTDVKLTARHYEKLAREDLRAGSQQLADSFWRGPVAATVTATAPDKDGQIRSGTTKDAGEGRRVSS